MIEKIKEAVNFTIEKGVIKTENGIPYVPRWFCDNRLAFEVYESEIGDIQFFNPNAGMGNHSIFHRQFWGGMKLYLFNGEKRYILKAEECEIYPFGYFSQTKIDEKNVNYGVFTYNDTIYFTIDTPKQFSGYNLGLEFYDEYFVCPNPDNNDFRFRNTEKRDWWEFKEENGTVGFGFSQGELICPITFAGTKPISVVRTLGNGKNKINMPLQTDLQNTFVVSFGTDASEVMNRAKSAVGSAVSDLEKQKNRYLAVAEKAPVLKSGNETLDTFFSLAPVYHEALKITEMAGGLRAKTTMYWMWGWDTMTSNAAVGYWGDKEFLYDMANCMMIHSDESGIAHAFDYKMKNGGAAPPTAQGIYVCLLNLLLNHGMNIGKYYDFAKKLFNMITDTEYKNMGLCSGTSLVPDYRDLVRETGKDISTFNNSIGYCAARSMAVLAREMGDKDTEQHACAFADRMLSNFPLLYNKKLGFFDSSVEEDTFAYRNVPSNNSFKWENDFAIDLVEDYKESLADFYENNLLSAGGIRPYLLDSGVYDEDANQLSAWWPNVTELFCKLANLTDRPHLLESWLSSLTPWMERLAFPEGVSCYADNPLFLTDNWNSQSGTWQAFATRAVYSMTVECYFGVSVDSEGLNIRPYSGREMSLNNLHYGEKILNIDMRGSGKNIEKIILNGEHITPCKKIAKDMLKDINDIIVYRV